MEIPLFITVLGLSLVVALTGAMAPGPLLTYTILQSARTPRHGYAMGAWIILGHAAIEALIILTLLTGFSFLPTGPAAVKTVGVIGALVLVGFGLSMLRDVWRESVPLDLWDGELPQITTPAEAPALRRRSVINNPVLGGALVSMANPYWWVWWATIGFAFMTEFKVSFDNPGLLAAFFIGHEAGDLLWYLLVSALSFWGVRRLDRRWYYGLLSVCAVFMIGFGIYLGLAPFLFNS